MEPRWTRDEYWLLETVIHCPAGIPFTKVQMHFYIYRTYAACSFSCDLWFVVAQFIAHSWVLNN